MQPSFRVFSVDIFLCYYVNFSLGEKEMCDKAKQRKKNRLKEKRKLLEFKSGECTFLGYI